jgi:hypothetical protein
MGTWVLRSTMGTCRSDHLTEKTCHTTPLRRYPPPPSPQPPSAFLAEGEGGLHVACCICC